MNGANFHLAFFFLLSLKLELSEIACKGSGEKPGCSLCIWKSYLAFPSDHRKQINYFLGKKLFSKMTLMEAETNQPNMVTCEHLFGSKMKQSLIFCGIILCQGVSYLVEGSNCKIYLQAVNVLLQLCQIFWFDWALAKLKTILSKSVWTLTLSTKGIGLQ